MTWWRKQRVALISLVIAASAVFGVHLWLDVLPSMETEKITEVGAGQTTVIAGQKISMTSVRWDEFEAPTGMQTISVRLDASGGQTSKSCGAFTLSEQSGGRVWVDARSALVVPFDAGESSCREESTPYEILAVFLIPDDTEGPFLFDVPGDDTIARFSVEQ